MARPRWKTDEEARHYQIGDPWTLEVWLTDADTGMPLVITSATVSILNSGGGALPSPITDASITPVSNRLSYTLSSTAITGVQRNMQARFVATVGGVAYTYRHLFDAVYVAPVMTADLSDVAAGIRGVDKLATPGDSTNQEILREGWSDVLEWLRGLGRYPDLVVDQRSLKKGHVLRTRYLLFNRAARAGNQSAREQADAWQREWEEWKASAAIAIDEDASGTLDEGEHPRSVALVNIGRREVGQGPVGPGLRPDGWR